jgi:OmpA-OmpF porin, OOP family
MHRLSVRRLLACGFALVASLPAAVGAQASEEVSQRHVGVLGTLGLPDDSRTAVSKGTTGLHLLYGVQRANGWGYELGAFGAVLETGDTAGADFYRWGAGADLTYAFGDRNTELTPFALAGVQYAFNDVQPNHLDSWDWGLNLGLGLVTRPMWAELLRFRGEIRGVYDNYGSGYLDYQVGLGVELLLARPRAVVVEREVRMVPALTCPAPAPSAPVDHEGCALEAVTRLDGVTFEFDKTRLRPDAQTILKGVAETLQRYPELQVEIAGHTDSMGSDEYNLALSQRRAEAVRESLVRHGVDAGRITAVGYGESQPVVSNETEGGREFNRRVEMRIKNLPAVTGSRLPR